jgi:hypothetical protein
MAPVHFTD